jgi:hypothetical protein
MSGMCDHKLAVHASVPRLLCDMPDPTFPSLLEPVLFHIGGVLVFDED